MAAVHPADSRNSNPSDRGSHNPDVRRVYELQLRPENLPIRNWLERDGWCWAITSRPEMPDEMFPELKRRGLRAAVMVLAHPEPRRRQWNDGWQLPVPGVAEVMTRYRRALGTNFAWEAFTEDDSMGVGFSKDLLWAQPRTHRAAQAMLGDYLAKAIREVRWTREGNGIEITDRISQVGISVATPDKELRRRRKAERQKPLKEEASLQFDPAHNHSDFVQLARQRRAK